MKVNLSHHNEFGNVLELYSSKRSDFETLLEYAHRLASLELCENLSSLIDTRDHKFIAYSTPESVVGDHLVLDEITGTHRFIATLDEWGIIKGLIEPFVHDFRLRTFQWITGHEAEYVGTDESTSLLISCDAVPSH